MRKVGGRRNFGWGKKLEWAGKQALRAAFGNGHYSTVASHVNRWRKFCEWLRKQGIRDARQISRAELAQFAGYLAQRTDEDMSIAYAKNQLSSANVVLESLRGDRTVWVKPGDFLGRRSTVRSSVPGGMDRAQVKVAADTLTATGKQRVAAVALLCRELGLRRREASLLDVRLAHHQAAQLGRVNIVAGTKGGRGKTVDRWVPVSDTAMQAIRFAETVIGNDSKLVPADQSLAQWLPRISKDWTNAVSLLGLGNLRDLRAAYACDRYVQLTGIQAPVVAGGRATPKSVDREARQAIAQELGHNRPEVIAAYIGSAR